MKSTIIASLAVAAIGASVQDTTVVTEYYDDCTTTSMPAGGMATVTGTITDTYCGECPLSASGTTTVYTTTYEELCPTGIQPAAYTITEPYSSGQDFGPTHVPSGFVVTTVTCPVCPGSPMITLTTPVAPAASTPGAPVISSAAPMGASSMGMSSMGMNSAAPAMPSMGAAAPAMSSMGAAAPTMPSMGAAAPAMPSMGAAAPDSSAPGQRIAGVASPSGDMGSSNGTMPSPSTFTGAASSMSVGMTLCAAIAGLVGGVALAL